MQSVAFILIDMRKSKTTPATIQEAASQLGKRSWAARLKRYGITKLKKKLSAAGKAAKHSGRPRLPDDQVKPNTLYQRQRRARLKVQVRKGKGGRKNGTSN